ncbi:hypothetical protein JCM19236_416 [Vibrio sp. JCM 19236]|nr:hypothetical protein JCM19236_416 [Vibrio sp. JCM 19236]
MIFLFSVLAIASINLCISNSLFRHWLLLFTGIIGVTLHEFSHYLIAKAFGFKITQVRWFQMPTRSNPNMGYVAFTRPRTVLGSLGHVLVSIAPLLIGATCLYFGSQHPFIANLASKLQAQSLVNYPMTLITHLSKAGLGDVLSLFALASVTLYMLPSWTDIKGALEGSLYLSLAIYILLSLGVVYLSQLEQIILYWLNTLGTLMSLGVFLSIPIALFALLTRR